MPAKSTAGQIVILTAGGRVGLIWIMMRPIRPAIKATGRELTRDSDGRLIPAAGQAVAVTHCVTCLRRESQTWSSTAPGMAASGRRGET